MLETSSISTMSNKNTCITNNEENLSFEYTDSGSEMENLPKN